MDLIAIADFAAGWLACSDHSPFLVKSCDCHVILGAMENWGLITYRDRLLLVDPKETPESSKQLVAIVVGK